MSISTSSIQSFLKKSNLDEILNGRFLPDNNNIAFVDSSQVAVVSVMDGISSNQTAVVAVGALLVYSNTQVNYPFSPLVNSFAKI